MNEELQISSTTNKLKAFARIKGKEYLDFNEVNDPIFRQAPVPIYVHDNKMILRVRKFNGFEIKTYELNLLNLEEHL